MSATVILETLRRHFAHIAYVAAVLLIVIITATMAAVGAPPGSTYQLFGLFTVIAGCQIIGPEFSSGTLQLILSKPIHRARYLVSRVAGVVLALWIGIALAFVTDAVARAVAGKTAPLMESGGAAVAVAAEAVLVCSLLVLFGSFTRSYMNAGLYIGGQIVLSTALGLLRLMERMETGAFSAVGAFLRAHPAVNNTFRTIHDNIYPDAPGILFDRNWLLMIFSNAAVTLVLACLIFRRREVPYGAD